MKRPNLGLLFLAASTLTVNAAPPESCVQKFTGQWMYDDGSATITLRSDGTQAPSGWSWSCDGSSFVLNSPGHTVGQLSSDGMRITGTMERTKPRPTPVTFYRQSAQPTQSGAVSGACPNDPTTYVKTTRVGNNRFRLENQCRQKAIQVNFKTAAVAPDCSLENATQLLDAAGRATVQSYCGVEPVVVSATFAAGSAR